MTASTEGQPRRRPPPRAREEPSQVAGRRPPPRAREEPSQVAGHHPPGARQRIVQAAYECVARWGFSKTTVEDVAREAGVSRATLYRHFAGGRDELLAAVVAWENARFFARLYDEVRDAATLEEVMELGIVFAHRDILEHDVLQRVLDTEPELLLPKLTVEAEGTQRMIAAFFEPYLARERLAPGVGVEEAADFLARMVLSYVSAPGGWDLSDRAQVARLVRGELLGGVLPPASPARAAQIVPTVPAAQTVPTAQTAPTVPTVPTAQTIPTVPTATPRRGE